MRIQLTTDNLDLGSYAEQRQRGPTQGPTRKSTLEAPQRSTSLTANYRRALQPAIRKSCCACKRSIAVLAAYSQNRASL